jgi:hypothetical protein
MPAGDVSWRLKPGEASIRRFPPEKRVAIDAVVGCG